jgi:hypothetical protein
MATRPIVTDPSQDITACDREPIHIPGAIQPHGLLLVVDAPTLTVIAGAGSIEDRHVRDHLRHIAPQQRGERQSQPFGS